MSTEDSEAASRRHYQINTTINSWKARHANVDLSPPQEFPGLQTTFQAIMSERKVKPLDIPFYVKMLQDAEVRRAATACAEIFERMDKELFFGLCQNLGPSLCQEWFNEFKGINQLTEDITPSNNGTQLSPGQTADDLYCIRESSPSEDGGKEPWKGFSRKIIYDPSTAENESFQSAELTSPQPNEVGYTDRLDHEPRTSPVRLRKIGQDENQRSNKRHCRRKPQDTQVDLDDQYSSDQSEDTAPFTDDDSEARTGFYGDKGIENGFNEVNKDQVHQST
ncbi:hypothetical protein NOF04DRAFT_1390210 [Fusarium oxysporum II5]|uniref:Uncharacterized protein n=2 Tax=Fusarium oxysporum f. sp. cubense TaxID=61366 RepID=N4V0P9_FUSC1|nr:hypothetical protein FOC1_g10001368 [Fusarium oxysporum f. sp. cubense race 1]KAK2122186.1 hypothetical protein NOF04DRAFT_1390210 [Fusarium oxysporum II5]TVY74320.1 hypothetical protein Focb16_v005535 [Fusarium oxysporum f. sp. cubense]TXB98106.1 hypothetical protein FocTR4_00017171 [Fusarium oxysporum f. sp. cubense]